MPSPLYYPPIGAHSGSIEWFSSSSPVGKVRVGLVEVGFRSVAPVGVVVFHGPFCVWCVLFNWGPAAL